MQVLSFNTIEYQVRDEKGMDFTVNIQNKTCTCRRFQEDEIPCGHAVAVIVKRNLNVYEYCASFYKTETLKALYQENVRPLPHRDQWNLPQHLQITVLPQKTTILAGRPKKKGKITPRGIFALKNYKKNQQFKDITFILMPLFKNTIQLAFFSLLRTA